MALRTFAPIAVTLSLLIHIPTGSGPQAAEPMKSVYSLDEILTLALERNPTVAGAQGLIKQSRGQRIAAGAYPNPSLTGNAGRGAIRDPSTGVHITERTITVEQPIEWTGKRQARQEAAEAGVEGAHAALEETRLSLRADVKVAVYQLLYAERDAELSAHNLTTIEEVLRTVKARVAAGEATSFDSMKAGVEVQKAQKELSRAQNALIVARAKVNTLAGGALGKQFSIQGDFSSGPRLEPEQIAARALEEHPTVRRLHKLAEQAGHTVQYERASRVPTVAVIGQYHREAGDESMTAGLSVPLPLWYRRQGEIEAALGAQYRAEADRRRVQNELEQAITQHAQELRTALDQLQVFETGLLKQAEQTLHVARTSFRHGAASLLDLLDAQRVYRQTLLEYAQVRTELSIAAARLERAVGAPL
ncbi:MAG TPA: TolC family protein [Nitrospira sp.]|nr:TolC family protein [Nitrospira sp.]